MIFYCPLIFIVDIVLITYLQAPTDQLDFIAKIVEMFETTNGEMYICTQWFYRAKDTVRQLLCNRQSYTACAICETILDPMISGYKRTRSSY